MKVLYDWLKEYVGDATPEIGKVEEIFTFHAFEVDGVEKVGTQDVIDVKVLPDRSSDCLSHRGIARELSALTGTPLRNDPFAREALLAPQTQNIEVTLSNSEQCRRFGAALVTGITIAESPVWLKERLQALGQRSINNVVDATNYVMLALGQPLHAYDADKLSHVDGTWRLGVRMAHEGESITTLSHETYTLKGTIQLVVDTATDSPLGIAGIKGGTHAEIDTTTTSIIVEAANFNPQSTRRATQSLRLQTDASKRFENDISPALIPYALIEIVSLITDIAGGTCEGYVDVYPHPTQNVSVYVSYAHINGLLGITIPTHTIETIFSRLGFTFVSENNGWQVTAPFERTDINIAEDIIAEIGRMHGYEHIVSVPPTRAVLTEYNARHYYAEKIRTVLIDAGFSEVITSSFRKKDTIELLNALAKDKGCMRSTLRENIREALERNMSNLDLLGLESLQVFEIGTVFNKTDDAKDVMEHLSVALGVRTKQQGPSGKDTERLKEVLAMLEVTLGVSLDANIVDGICEFNLTQLLLSLPNPTAYDAYVADHGKTFVPFSTYPFISRDIAVWVPEQVSASDVEAMLRNNAGMLLVRLTPFDVFKKDNRISYAFRLVFQSTERTLTYEEVSPIMDLLTEEMKKAGFEVR